MNIDWIFVLLIVFLSVCALALFIHELTEVIVRRAEEDRDEEIREAEAEEMVRPHGNVDVLRRNGK